MKFADDNMKGKHLSTRKHTVLNSYRAIIESGSRLSAIKGYADIRHHGQKKLCIYCMITFLISQIISN